MTRGKVWLIGAGPGDPELVTLKAVRAMGEADFVLHDDLVNRAILAHARAGARIVHVGKRGGCRSTPQAFIERLMVRLARRGAVVARLKGGDPFVFGRGGEELAALRAGGVECEVVSGVTAGIGVPAAAGIPVTHRGVARGVAFVTGHTRDGAAPDWSSLARSGLTLVVYMGVATLPGVVADLRAGGMADATPAAVIQHGTTSRQRLLVTTLAELPAAVTAAGLASPAILVIGAVVATAQLSMPAVLQVAAA
ncbi:MAG TPA: uroporphyrinogen-III C-methyltransferase [Burkholderiales bacterium]|nr:uroporphyrinogen-III C-methyltransferase [Burkholderiales bacterium]